MPKIAFAALLLLSVSHGVLAQSSPEWADGDVPTVGDWNTLFRNKLNLGLKPTGGAAELAAPDYLLRLAVPVETFGAVCDGVTDDTVAMNAAAAAMGGIGGGTLVVAKRCLVDSADLSLPEGVRLQGPRHVGFQRQGLGYDNIQGALLLNPAFRVLMGSNTALRDVVLLRKGLVTPTSARTALDQISAFAGTAVYIHGGSDVALDDVTILGFNRCIDSGYANRPLFRGVRGDCLNGVRVDNSHDVPRMEGVHFWPALTANQVWTFGELPIVSAMNNGAGMLRVTLASHNLKTGDSVNVIAPGSAVPVYAVATVIDAAHVEFATVPYLGTYTGSGKIIVDTTRRNGIAYEVTNSESYEISNSFAYGYTQGVHLGTRAGWTHLINVSVDGYGVDQESGTKGILLDGDAYGTSVVGGFLSSQGSAVHINTVDGEAHSFTGVSFNPGNGAVIQLSLGSATFTGNHSPTCCTGQISVASGFGSATFVGNEFPTLTLTYASDAARGRVLLVGNHFLPGTPTLQVVGSSGGLVMTMSEDGTMALPNLNVGGCPILSGMGVPQQPAPPCALFMSQGGGSSSTLYVKETGTDASGWVAK